MTEPVSEVPVRCVVPLTQMFGENEEETQLLRPMALYAREYIHSFTWCKSIRESYFGDGIGNVVAIFLFRIEPADPEVDEWLWVIVGDLPPAYLVTDDSNTPSEALEGYIDEMQKWVALAMKGRSSKRVIPVNAPATPEYAESLQARLKVLHEVMVPKFQAAEIARA